ncbi:NAD(+)/NADH kinase [archaeon]|nr:NAD(+)/NADH kinase [archaeon]
MPPQAVGVLYRPDHPEARRLAYDIAAMLKAHGVRVFFDPESPPPPGFPSLTEVSISPEMVIAVGGDGTILRCLRRYDVPILAVMLGHRCLLGEVVPGEVREAVERLIADDYYIEEFRKLRVLVAEQSFLAANEVVICSSRHFRMLWADVKLGELRYRIASDAIIVATSLGSTAHALSAGGPVIYPDLDCLVIVAVCPLEKTPALVIPSNQEIVIDIDGRDYPVTLIVDGEIVSRELPSHTELRIRMARKTSKFVRFKRPPSLRRIGQALVTLSAHL